MKENNLEDFFDNEENEINENDYIKYNNFRHKEIRRSKGKIPNAKLDK